MLVGYELLAWLRGFLIQGGLEFVDGALEVGAGAELADQLQRRALVSIREAIELYLETLTHEERTAALSQEILTTAVEVHA